MLYFVWGATFLAIRVGVREVPPFLFASLRFLLAGALVYGWMSARGERSPTPRQWLSISSIALLTFVVNYGLLFWAQTRVPSGAASVLRATIPAFVAVTEILLLRTQRLTLRLAFALTLGIAGVAVLVGQNLHVSGNAVDPLGAAAILFGALSWSIACVLIRMLDLPRSQGINAGAQMLVGGAILAAISASLGEFHRFHPAALSTNVWIAWAFLVLFGSVLGFTAYIWLIQHESPTKVGTYAYVNPVVAVLLGALVAHEPLDARTLLGTVFILVSVIAITTTSAKSARKI